MADHTWILDVYDDIRQYAQMNNLQGIADSITEMRNIAEAETNAAASVNRHDKVLGGIVGPTTPSAVQ